MHINDMKILLKLIPFIAISYVIFSYAGFSVGQGIALTALISLLFSFLLAISAQNNFKPYYIRLSPHWPQIVEDFGLSDDKFKRYLTLHKKSMEEWNANKKLAKSSKSLKPLIEGNKKLDSEIDNLKLLTSVTLEHLTNQIYQVTHRRGDAIDRKYFTSFFSFRAGAYVESDDKAPELYMAFNVNRSLEFGIEYPTNWSKATEKKTVIVEVPFGLFGAIQSGDKLSAMKGYEKAPEKLKRYFSMEWDEI